MTADAAREPGRVVASHGRQLLVESASGERVSCRLHGRRLAAVCGDEVEWSRDSGQSSGTVYAILPRRRTLARLAGNGRPETIVANLTQLVVVVAPRPAPDWFVVDRYLAGASWSGVGAVIACNKVELGLVQTTAEELAAYQAIGYSVVHCSARATPGTAALAATLAGATSVLVGQSGAGKSSLLNALAPEACAVTQEISAASDQGRHTTTHAVLHRLASGGDLIDSPGVRDYAPPLPAVREIASGFAEIAAAAGGCRFQDCLHTGEPACAVAAAHAAGRISERRLQSYRRLLELARQLATRYPDRRPPRVS